MNNQSQRIHDHAYSLYLKGGQTAVLVSGSRETLRNLTIKGFIETGDMFDADSAVISVGRDGSNPFIYGVSVFDLMPEIEDDLAEDVAAHVYWGHLVDVLTRGMSVVDDLPQNIDIWICGNSETLRTEMIEYAKATPMLRLEVPVTA